MDYKKKYDEALSKCKAYIDDTEKRWSEEFSRATEEVFKEIFPELRESEDERIRKHLIQFLKGEVHEIDVEETLAYLEKQKENPKSADSIPSDCVSDAKCGNSRHKVGDSLEGRRLADEVVAYLIKSGYQPTIKDTLEQKHFQIKIPRHKEDFFQSKEYKHCREILDEYYYECDFAGDVYTLYVLWQKEQKPVEWTELTWKDIVELEGIINNVHYDFSAGIGQESFGKEVLERFRNKKDDAEVDACEQKPEDRFEEAREKYQVEWSKEDKENLLCVCGLLKHYLSANYKGSKYWDDVQVDEWIEWAKNLPNRFQIQPKQEWSEEDEKMINNIVSVLGQYIDYKAVSGTGSGYAIPRYSKEISWLKSLRPQLKNL